jgi:hypothetical protein
VHSLGDLPDDSRQPLGANAKGVKIMIVRQNDTFATAVLELMQELGNRPEFRSFAATPVRYVLMDRDTKFTAEFQAILTAAEVKPVLLPPKSPNCNAHLERFFRSLKEEALSRIIFFGETALRNATTEFLLHYHGERAHQGLDHQILLPGSEVGQKVGGITCRERLGGLLKYYHRQAA